MHEAPATVTEPAPEPEIALPAFDPYLTESDDELGEAVDQGSAAEALGQAQEGTNVLPDAMQITTAVPVDAQLEAVQIMMAVPVDVQLEAMQIMTAVPVYAQSDSMRIMTAVPVNTSPWDGHANFQSQWHHNTHTHEFKQVNKLAMLKH